MVDIEQLQIDLEAYGTVVLCEANEFHLLVVMDGVNNGDNGSIESIINTHGDSDYPIHFNYTLVNGVLKCERTK